VVHQREAWRRPGAQGRPGYTAAIVYSSVKNVNSCNIDFGE